VVTARADGTLGKRLTAYLVTGGDRPDAAELRRSLAARLPDYMIPAAFVVLDRLPLTAHGKVDRRALPEPDGSTASGERVAPRSEIEQILAELFCQQLGATEIGVYDDFFALGGHSLGVTRLLSRIRHDLEVEVPVGEFFRDPTVAGLAVAIAASLMRDLGGDEVAEMLSGLDFDEVDAGDLGGLARINSR
jgi:Phosphopantetheine attachment site/AMP-binding enzyme C-terminal domain